MCRVLAVWVNACLVMRSQASRMMFHDGHAHSFVLVRAAFDVEVALRRLNGTASAAALVLCHREHVQWSLGAEPALSWSTGASRQYTFLSKARRFHLTLTTFSRLGAEVLRGRLPLINLLDELLGIVLFTLALSRVPL